MFDGICEECTSYCFVLWKLERYGALGFFAALLKQSYDYCLSGFCYLNATYYYRIALHIYEGA